MREYFKKFSKKRKALIIICCIIFAFCLYKMISYEFLSTEEKIIDAINFNAVLDEEIVDNIVLTEDLADSQSLIISENEGGGITINLLKFEKVFFVFTSDYEKIGEDRLFKDEFEKISKKPYFENIKPLLNLDMPNCYVGIIVHDENNTVLYNNESVSLAQFTTSDGEVFDYFVVMNDDSPDITINGKAY